AALAGAIGQLAGPVEVLFLGLNRAEAGAGGEDVLLAGRAEQARRALGAVLAAVPLDEQRAEIAAGALLALLAIFLQPRQRRDGVGVLAGAEDQREGVVGAGVLVPELAGAAPEIGGFLQIARDAARRLVGVGQLVARSRFAAFTGLVEVGRRSEEQDCKKHHDFNPLRSARAALPARLALRR